ncbi:15293_t:CDS:1, partial [Funneliformis geosporum]
FAKYFVGAKNSGRMRSPPLNQAATGHSGNSRKWPNLVELRFVTN